MTIMVVKTNRSQLKILTKNLTSLCKENNVVSFSDPLLAVQYGFNNRVDILFTQINMRGLSGKRVSNGIHQHNEGMKTCYIVASEEETDNVTKPDLYLIKPVTETAIRQVYSALVEPNYI